MGSLAVCSDWPHAEVDVVISLLPNENGRKVVRLFCGNGKVILMIWSVSSGNLALPVATAFAQWGSKRPTFSIAWIKLDEDLKVNRLYQNSQLRAMFQAPLHLQTCRIDFRVCWSWIFFFKFCFPHSVDLQSNCAFFIACELAEMLEEHDWLSHLTSQWRPLCH